MENQLSLEATIASLKSDNIQLTKELYACYQERKELTAQVEYLKQTMQGIENQLELFSVDKLNMKELVAILKDIKRQFKLANTDQISFSKKVNNYQKYITNDYDSFEIALRCPIGVRAAGYHNYLLNNNANMKGKYQPLGNGEKLKMYFTTDPVSNVFAYAPGERPYEFAPDVDYDTQFEKTILDPINRVINAMGFKGLNRNLIYTSAVF